MTSVWTVILDELRQATTAALPTIEDVPFEIPHAIPSVRVAGKKRGLSDLLIEVGLERSKSGARRVVEQRGVKVDGMTIEDPHAEIAIPKGGVLIQKGKRHFVLVVGR